MDTRWVALYFILYGGTGYIPPMEVKNPPCGIVGEKVGVTFDRSPNPTTVYWPDPYFPGTHCAVDIRSKLAGLPVGTYEFATTEMEDGDVIVSFHIDPHTSDTWVKVSGTETQPRPPLNVRVKGHD